MDYQYTTSPGTAGSAIADIHVIVRRSKAASLARRISMTVSLVLANSHWRKVSGYRSRVREDPPQCSVRALIDEELVTTES